MACAVGKSDFGAVAIQKACIVSSTKVTPDIKPYTVYLIETICTCKGIQVIGAIFRRYSEFRSFEKKLRVKFPQLLPHPFPPKKLPAARMEPMVLDFLCPGVMEARQWTRGESSQWREGHITEAQRFRAGGQSRPRHIYDLPIPLLRKVLANLGYRELLAASMVCKAWNAAANHNSLWKQMSMHYNPPSVPLPGLDSYCISRPYAAKTLFIRSLRSCARQRRSKFINGPCPCAAPKVLASVIGTDCKLLKSALTALSPSSTSNSEVGMTLHNPHFQCSNENPVCLFLHTYDPGPEAEAQLRYFMLRSNFVIISFSLEDNLCLDFLPSWMSSIRYHCPHIPVYLLGISSNSCPITLSSHRALATNSSFNDLADNCLSEEIQNLGWFVGAAAYFEVCPTSRKEVRSCLAAMVEKIMPSLDQDGCATEAEDLDSEKEEEDEYEAESSFHNAGEEAHERTARLLLHGARRQYARQLRHFCIDGMTCFVHSSALWERTSSKERQRVRLDLEAYVFRRIYHRVFRPAIDQQRDEILQHRISCLSFVTPSHLEIPSHLWDPQTWEIAGEAILNMNSEVSPQGKLRCILTCSKAIIQLLRSRKSLSGTGADDFLPHLVYTVIRTNPPFLASNLAFISRFTDPTECPMQSYYYYTSLEVAVSFTESLDASSLNIAPQDFARLTGKTLQKVKASALLQKRSSDKAYRTLGIEPSLDKARQILGEKKVPSLQNTPSSGFGPKSSGGSSSTPGIPASHKYGSLMFGSGSGTRKGKQVEWEFGDLSLSTFHVSSTPPKLVMSEHKQRSKESSSFDEWHSARPHRSCQRANRHRPYISRSLPFSEPLCSSSAALLPSEYLFFDRPVSAPAALEGTGMVEESLLDLNRIPCVGEEEAGTAWDRYYGSDGNGEESGSDDDDDEVLCGSLGSPPLPVQVWQRGV